MAIISSFAPVVPIAISLDSPLSMMVWVNINSGVGTGTFITLQSGDNGWTRIHRPDLTTLSATNMAEEDLATGTIAAYPGSDYIPHHVAYVYDGSYNYLYFNGEQIDASNTYSPESVTSTVFIGQYYLGSSSTFNGTMADMRLYDRALTPGEIKSIASLKGKDRVLAGLKTRLMLDDFPIGEILYNW